MNRLESPGFQPWGGRQDFSTPDKAPRDVAEHAPTGPDGEFSTAFEELTDIPANVVNAFLNGYGPVDITMPLWSLTPSADGPDVDVTSVDLGGLLSPGGSFFDALGLNDDGTIGPAAGEPVGVLGSLVEIQQAVAVSLGWGGTGDPLDALFDAGI